MAGVGSNVHPDLEKANARINELLELIERSDPKSGQLQYAGRCPKTNVWQWFHVAGLMSNSSKARVCDSIEPLEKTKGDLLDAAVVADELTLIQCFVGTEPKALLASL